MPNKRSNQFDIKLSTTSSIDNLSLAEVLKKAIENHGIKNYALTVDKLPESAPPYHEAFGRMPGQ